MVALLKWYILAGNYYGGIEIVGEEVPLLSVAVAQGVATSALSF
jgi:hypothetical protein